MRFLRIKDVKEKTGLSRSTIYKKIDEGTFPRQIPIGARAVAWNSVEVDEWAEKQIALSRKQPRSEAVPHQIFQRLEDFPRQKRRAGYKEINLAGIPQTEGQRQEGVL